VLKQRFSDFTPRNLRLALELLKKPQNFENVEIISPKKRR
jgi:hypothetical protein